MLAAVIALALLLAWRWSQPPPSPVIGVFTGRITTLNLRHTAVCVGRSVSDQRCSDVYASHWPVTSLRIGGEVRVLVLLVHTSTPNVGSIDFVLLPTNGQESNLLAGFSTGPSTTTTPQRAA
ncbi:MAG TPA: hypothetical protein VED59_01625 [Acidimicrobiales bacterium]|nr:hypothetical protein [Acidimicrobiales bacterium]